MLFRSPPEYLQGNLDVAAGHVDVEWEGELVEASADPGEPGEHALGSERAGLPVGTEVDGRILVGRDVEVGAQVRFDGPCVIGDGARIKSSVLLPDAQVPAGCYLVGAIAGRSGSLTTRAT